MIKFWALIPHNCNPVGFDSSGSVKNNVRFAKTTNLPFFARGSSIKLSVIICPRFEIKPDLYETERFESSDQITTMDSNKRKAIELVEGDTNVCLATNLKRLATAMDDRLKRIEEILGTFASKDSFDRSIEAIVKASDSEAEEEFSDDEESIVDESDQWTFMFRQLRQYRIDNGDCLVPRNYKTNKKLACWVNRQRVAYSNLKNGKNVRVIKPDRIVKLESIGFHWGKKFLPPPSWGERYEELKDWMQKIGKAPPYDENNPSPLAKWMAYQRAEYKRLMKGRDSLLTLDQVQQLKEIGFKWKGPKL
jgi:hypothetical protein